MYFGTNDTDVNTEQHGVQFGRVGKFVVLTYVAQCGWVFKNHNHSKTVNARVDLKYILARKMFQLSDGVFVCSLRLKMTKISAFILLNHSEYFFLGHPVWIYTT